MGQTSQVLVNPLKSKVILECLRKLCPTLIKGLAPSLTRLSEDLLKLLTVRTGDWDLQIICRDERTVNCHKLVLQELNRCLI